MSWRDAMALQSCCKKRRFQAVQGSFTWKSADHWDPWDIRSSRSSQNGWKTARPSVALYLNELLVQKCKFRIQVSRHWPQLGLPQMALWHHVGVTIGITLDKNGSLYDPAGTESWNVQTSLDHLFYVRDSCSTSRNRSRTSNIVQQSSNQIPTIHRRHDKAK